MRIYTIAFILAAITISSQANGRKMMNRDGPAQVTQQICYTQMGTTKAKSVPTSTIVTTLTLPYPIIVKSTATSTVTPAPVTQTATSTVTSTVITTAETMTDTSTVTYQPSTTVTSTSTEITTATSIAYATTTTTVMTSTTTISPAGYTPLATQLAAAGVSYTRKRSPSRDLLLASRDEMSDSCHTKKYPQSVKCEKVVKEIVYKTITVLSSQTTTITVAPSTSSVTTTSTVTSTSTVAPPNASTTVTTTAATNTVSATTTTTLTTTTTTTQTTTQTADLSAATAYTSCQSDNVITTVKGKPVDGVKDSGTTINTVTASSALNCCQTCFTAALTNPSACSWYYYNPSGGCLLASNSKNPNQYLIYIGNVYTPAQMGNGAGGRYTGTTAG